MNNENIKSVAVCEFQDDEGITALVIHQTQTEIKNSDVYYAVFDTGKLTRAYKKLEDLKNFLMSIGFQEI